MMPDLFVSEDKTKFICVVGDSPSFIRGSHRELAKAKGVSLDTMDNLTPAFMYDNPKRVSINEYLNR